MGKSEDKPAAKDKLSGTAKTGSSVPAKKKTKNVAKSGKKPGAKSRPKTESESDYIRSELKKKGIVIDPKKSMTIAALRKLREQLG
jgi:hypothetical protein